jgi:hypothetical protein
MLRIITPNHCPVNLKYHLLKVLLYMAYRAFLVRVDLNLKSNMKTSIGIRLKMASGIPHQINNSAGWYQKVLFGGKVPKPRYNISLLFFTDLFQIHQCAVIIREQDSHIQH